LERYPSDECFAKVRHGQGQLPTRGLSPMTALIKYEAACLALAESHRVDEVKNIHDKTEAMRVYAIQAKNVDLEVMASEIRLRGERRLGELLIEAKQAGRLSRGQPKRNCGTIL
jgi:hypothetical protein